MTFEERMDWINEKHQALAQTVELIAIETRELGLRMDRMHAQHERESAETREHLRVLTSAIELDAENIRALAHIAESHERRLDRLERSGSENGNEPKNGE
jgi:hypothetical protein